MKKYQRLSGLWTMTILLMSLVFVLNCFPQGLPQSPKTGKSDRSKILPGGDWSISIYPYEEDSFSPVSLFSVSSNNARAEKVDIMNISNKPVVAIKLSWALYRDQNRSKIIKEGITPLLEFGSKLSSGKRGFIKYNVVAFNNIYESLSDKKRLAGNFNIDLRVEEVHFADDSIWQRQEGLSPDIKQELQRDAVSGDCAKQQCKGTASTEVIGAVTYSCEASTLNQRCQVNGGYSCSNVSCTQPGGGGGGGGGGGWEEIEIINP